MRKPDTLLVVAKQPAPGQTKTRLCPPLTPSQAAELYECFLRDTLDAMREVPGVEPVIGYLPDDAQDYFHQLAPDMSLIRQRGSSLGERLDDLLKQAITGGSQKAVVMDSDSPTLPADYLSMAFEQLTETDVVLGPTTDGGYYLIGVKQPQPRLLRQVQMSTSHVLADTLALAKASGLSVSLLPTWYDVDTIADLRRLESEIAEMSANGRAAATSRWLAHSGWRDLPE
jgi:rSAM/selenodomain-associated transferase 1